MAKRSNAARREEFVSGPQAAHAGRKQRWAPGLTLLLAGSVSAVFWAALTWLIAR